MKNGITPCLWFDTESEEAAIFMCLFSITLRSETSVVMEKRGLIFTENLKEQL